ncbi:branched-chain amino acid transport system substrate-binding protein [Pseudochelatococcus lubricantis]|uniref:Branched-chain amino acid transport system substrate-binding protein n=1 Tax=Pseudochelatococcus lubricantis TaxID=1538102 RepID=A0ABX0V178_9HYPH|nr:ABC transporter substrate-binding protein [Pseudochelatococcus lubricantis]NIJ58883.1 branched-chain amino acid transport system substrate-binding protein [Pseudochelatococcus lubricantis]
MKRYQKLLLSAAMLVPLVCGGARAEIVVGFITGLSGPVSSIGIPNAKGLQAGLEYQGEIDGEKIRIIQLDDTSDPSISTRNARKLVEQDQVDFLIGTSGAPQTVAMAVTAVELQVPMIAISPISPVAPGKDGPWVAQVPQPTSLLVQGIVDHMKASNVKTVAFIGFSDAFGDLMYNSLVQAAGAANIKVVADERYGRADTSVTAQVLRAVSTRPDAVMIGGTGTSGALPVLALKDRAYKGAVYGNHGMISTDFLRIAGSAANGIICPTGPVTVAEQLPESNPIRSVALAYRAAYEKVNGAPPSDGFSAYGFDGWIAFVDAAKRAKASGAQPRTPEFRKALREAIFNTREFVGTQGIYNFKPDNLNWVDERARVLIRIEDGKWKLLPPL